MDSSNAQGLRPALLDLYQHTQQLYHTSNISNTIKIQFYYLPLILSSYKRIIFHIIIIIHIFLLTCSKKIFHLMQYKQQHQLDLLSQISLLYHYLQLYQCLNHNLLRSCSDISSIDNSLGAFNIREDIKKKHHSSHFS